MKHVLAYCGSAMGRNPAHAAAARRLGSTLAHRGMTLVYGGGNVGLMGLAADAALAAGGEVIGVMPRILVDREVAHWGLTRLEVVETMHERKARMVGLAEAVVALPGGLGTLDELAEVLTWAQLGSHRLPVGLWNVEGFFDLLLAHLDRAVEEGFIRPANRGLWRVERHLEPLLEQLAVAARPSPPPFSR
ncbi:MAG: TIGR00730 family Rossman fold protein [Verrucomicrobiota bacterium]